MTNAIRAYDHNYNNDHKKILDFIRKESPLTMPPALVNEIFNHAFQLTAYEKNSCITDTDLYMYLATECEPVTVEQMNAYNELNNDYDSWIYSIDELKEVLHDESPITIAKMVQYGDFNINDDYFSFNGYGNLVSFNHYTFMSETENGNDIKAALIENNRLEYFTDTDQETIETALEYKDLIIDTALYMVSLGY